MLTWLGYFGRFGQNFLRGAGVTLELTAVGLAIGFVLGLLLASSRASGRAGCRNLDRRRRAGRDRGASFGQSRYARRGPH